MAIVKVKIRMKDAEFEAEGSREDVDAMLGVWWDKVLKEPNDTTDASGSSGDSAPKSKRQKLSKSRAANSPKDDATDSQKFDAHKLVNDIKQNPKAHVLTEKIWHQTDRYNKVALVCKLAGQPLTSGDVHRVLSGLQIKLALSNVSQILSKHSSKFLTSTPPVPE